MSCIQLCCSPYWPVANRSGGMSTGQATEVFNGNLHSRRVNNGYLNVSCAVPRSHKVRVRGMIIGEGVGGRSFDLRYESCHESMCVLSLRAHCPSTPHLFAAIHNREDTFVGISAKVLETTMHITPIWLLGHRVAHLPSLDMKTPRLITAVPSLSPR